MREKLNRLVSFFRTKDRDRDFDEELQSHLQLAEDEFVAIGLSPEEARRRARLRFGSVQAAKELHRDNRSSGLLENLKLDFRYAVRGMRRDPRFAVFAISITALGIGSSTLVFTVLSALLLRPLPFQEADRLVWIANAPPEQGLSAQTLQVLPFLAYKQRNHAFSDMAAYFAFYGLGDNRLQIGTDIERLNALPVSQNFFQLLGVRPRIGRLFSADECKWNGPKVAVLSHGLWKRRFNSDPHVVGRTIMLDDASVSVVGVLPDSFDFGTVFAPGTRMDIYTPFPLTAETDRWGNTISVVGRLKPNVTLPGAQAEANVLGDRISKEPHRGNDIHPKLARLQEHVTGKIRPALQVLASAVAAVMMIVCANLASLLLARSTGKQKEFSVRAAIGADRRRLISQVLTESMVLAGTGAVFGLITAYAGGRLLSSISSLRIPLLATLRPDFTSLFFAATLSILTGLVFGILPALRIAGSTVHDGLKESGRSSTESSRHNWIRNSLVVSEIAFACVLMVATGLLLHSFMRIVNVDLGFEPTHAATLRIDPSVQISKVFKIRPDMKDEDVGANYIAEALRRVRELSGVQAAGLADALPLVRNRTWNAAAQGVVYKEGEYPSAFVHIVSDDYLKAAGIPLRAGREFTSRDTTASEPVVLVNETLARNLWPGQSALGRMMIAGDNRAKRVVGVVKDVRHVAVEQGSGNEMYFPILQVFDWPSLHLVVRSQMNDRVLSERVRSALLPLDSGLPKEEFQPLQRLVDQSISPRRFTVILLSGFAAFALLLASLGIYALVSYNVTQRQQEMGIRMALGASPQALRNGVIRQTMTLAGTGILIGTLSSLLTTQAMRATLFEIKPSDPIPFAGMFVLLLIVALVASYLPARRASTVDPMIALRAE